MHGQPPPYHPAADGRARTRNCSPRRPTTASCASSRHPIGPSVFVSPPRGRVAARQSRHAGRRGSTAVVARLATLADIWRRSGRDSSRPRSSSRLRGSDAHEFSLIIRRLKPSRGSEGVRRPCTGTCGPGVLARSRPPVALQTVSGRDAVAAAAGERVACSLELSRHQQGADLPTKGGCWWLARARSLEAHHDYPRCPRAQAAFAPRDAVRPPGHAGAALGGRNPAPDHGACRPAPIVAAETARSRTSHDRRSSPGRSASRSVIGAPDSARGAPGCLGSPGWVLQQVLCVDRPSSACRT